MAKKQKVEVLNTNLTSGFVTILEALTLFYNQLDILISKF